MVPINSSSGAASSHTATPVTTKKKENKEKFDELTKEKSTLSKKSTSDLEKFWILITKIFLKIPFIRDLVQSWWENSSHLLRPKYNEKRPNLSALPFDAPNYFTDDMKENVSNTIAKTYQLMMKEFRKARIRTPITPAERESFADALISLCYSTHRDCIKGQGANRCHTALYDAYKAWANKMPPNFPVHLGTSSTSDPKDRKKITSDFFAAFCPQLKTSTISDLHVHGPFERESDLAILFKAIETNTSLRQVAFDLDKKTTEHILPKIAHLIEKNRHLTAIIIKNYSIKRDFVIEEEVWSEIATQVSNNPNISLQFINTPHMPPPLLLPINQKVSFVQN